MAPLPAPRFWPDGSGASGSRNSQPRTRRRPRRANRQPPSARRQGHTARPAARPDSYRRSAGAARACQQAAPVYALESTDAARAGRAGGAGCRHRGTGGHTGASVQKRGAPLGGLKARLGRSRQSGLAAALIAGDLGGGDHVSFAGGTAARRAGTMKGIVYERYGPDAVELRDVEQPSFTSRRGRRPIVRSVKRSAAQTSSRQPP